jgi:hypothetical protein
VQHEINLLAAPQLSKGECARLASARRRYTVTALLVVWTLALFPLSVSANHAWGGYHWARTSNPFTLKVGDNVSSQWDGILDTTITDWTKSTVLNLTKIAGQSTNKHCRATTGRVEVCNGTYGNNGWLGVASIWASGTHITQGTGKLNDTYFNTAQYNTTAWRNLVSCQEVGHTLGLDHQDENFDNANLGTCMDYTNNPGTNQHPNAHDYDQLVSIYSHLDSTTTIGAMPAAMANGDFTDAGSWGRLISTSQSGAAALYERDFGHGHKVFTFVYWAVGGN